MKPAIICDREIMGGTPVMSGTRTPFQTVLDDVEAGASLDTFLEDFPRVAREAAKAALQQAGDLAMAHACAA